MIINIPFMKTELLQKEIDAIENGYKEGGAEEYFNNFFKPFPNLESYIRNFSRFEKLEFFRCVKTLGNAIRILDIGSGRGETSIYLASLGHQVSVIEPSLAHCEFIEYAAKRYNLNLNIYLCTAESLNKVNDKFDAIIFNSSFHHCDDPQLALKNCYQALVDGGILLITNEPVLPLFRAKKWYFKKLINNAAEMGHYGGNEHIYYYFEYENMLKKAGFKKIKNSLNIRYSDYYLAAQHLKDYEERLRNFAKGINQWDTGWDLKMKRRRIYKTIYSWVICTFYKSEIICWPFLELLKRLSLLQMSFLMKK